MAVFGSDPSQTRIWLVALAKVAVNLGVTRLYGRFVPVPVRHIIASSGTFRAYLYAVVHGGRQKVSCQRGRHHNGRFAGQHQSQERKPIGREALTAMLGVSRPTQTAYETRSGMRVQRNYAIGGQWSEVRWQDACWRRGRAAFEFIDYRGKIGMPGQRYVAWQLPNSYVSPLPTGGRGRTRKLNKQIADLRMQRGAGNGYQWQQRRYFWQGGGRCFSASPG